MSIKFGTDGWRAIIANDYTFDNLARVAEATGRWIRESGITDQGIVIGYDGRFQGRAFAKHAARIFAEMGLKVRLADSISPTPAVSWASKHFDAIGIVITASHNPPEYNGFKIKAPFGGPATPAQIDEVEKQLDLVEGQLDLRPYEDYQSEGLIEDLALNDRYLQIVKSHIDLVSIRESNLKVAHDPMYGAGQGLIKKLLGDHQVVELHSEFNPGFHGQAPEPIEKNLGGLSDIILDENCDVGIANDGDADRIGMFDERGQFVNSHQLLSLLTKYLSQNKGMKGSIIKTFSTTTMLDKQAKKYELPIETTPIGFKYIAEKMIDQDVLVGGEESGGLAVKGHIPERDGIFIGLLIMEMIVKTDKPLSNLVQELNREFGEHYFYRNDLHTSDEKKSAMVRYCENGKLTEIAGQKVVDREFIDGTKHHLEDGSWLLVRPSGTEPVLRIYSEAGTQQQAVDLVESASEKVDDPEILKATS